MSATWGHTDLNDHQDVQIEPEADYLVLTDERVGSIPLDFGVFDVIAREMGYVPAGEDGDGD